MKTKVAMAISLSGVLAAGTAAALVNTQVLNGGSSGAPIAAALDNQETVNSAPITIGDMQPDTTAPGVETPVDASAPTQATYAVGDAGTVTLDTANGVLTIIDTVPAAGWSVSQAETDGSSNAEVKFQSGSVEVEFHANLLYGVVNTSMESNESSGDDDGVSERDDDSDHGNDDGDHHEDDDDHGGDDD